MSILSVKKGFSGLTAGGSETALTTVATYSVVTDSVSDGPLAVKEATDPTTGLKIPVQNTPHPDDPYYLSGVPRVSLVCPTFFNVQVPYSTRSGESQSSQYSDPLDEPANISWGDANSVEPIDIDIIGNPILNSAREPFDPPIATEIKDSVLTISRNEAAFTSDVKYAFENTVNLDAFCDANPGRARMVSITANKVHANPAYWRVKYEIQFRMQVVPGVSDAETWFRRVLNQGYHYLDSDGERQAIMEKGIKVSQPKLLAADGSVLPVGCTPIWLKFKVYFHVDWGLLGLDF